VFETKILSRIEIRIVIEFKQIFKDGKIITCTRHGYSQNVIKSPLVLCRNMEKNNRNKRLNIRW